MRDRNEGHEGVALGPGARRAYTDLRGAPLRRQRHARLWRHALRDRLRAAHGARPRSRLRLGAHPLHGRPGVTRDGEHGGGRARAFGEGRRSRVDGVLATSVRRPRRVPHREDRERRSSVSARSPIDADVVETRPDSTQLRIELEGPCLEPIVFTWSKSGVLFPPLVKADGTVVLVNGRQFMRRKGDQSACDVALHVTTFTAGALDPAFAGAVQASSPAEGSRHEEAQFHLEW